VARILRFQADASLSFAQFLGLFPGQSAFPSAIAACFIGTVGGMIERSAYKCFLGGLLGAAGGAAGAAAYPFFEKLFLGYLYNYSCSLGASWALAGAMIGLSSGLLEGTKRKMSVGTLGGFLGGLVGGAIGSQMYGAMLMEAGALEHVPWTLGRAIELLSGGIIGVSLWSFLGLSEKLYIYRRRQLTESDKKICDQCLFENGLKSWYCAQCGSALQVAASREQIRVTPFRGLERISNAFQYLSWLSATAGVITAAVIFLTFLAQNFLFAFFGALLVGLIVYICSIFFRALSDFVRMGMQIAEKGARETP
jgi:MFS family permease